MSLRQITVIHVLPVQNTQGYHGYFLAMNPRWQNLALPAKKIANVVDGTLDPQTIRAGFDDVWHQELGIDAVPTWTRPLEPFTLRLCSPAVGEMTEYRILPVLAPVPRREQRALQTKLGGTWSTRGDLLALPHLSPTARMALERIHLAPTVTSAPPQDSSWTARLLWCRESCDREFLGCLLQDMEPWLRAQLRSCAQTRALFDNPVDVEEALQDALLSVIQHLNDFNDTASASTWVWIITRNSAITILRKRTRNAADSLHTPDGYLRPLVGQEGSLLERLESLESQSWRVEVIREVLERADPLHRHAWELRVRDDLTYQEIAAELGHNMNTIVGWIRRINQRLQQRAERSRQ